MTGSSVGNGIRSYTDLVVWQKSVELSVAAYAFARALPATERYAMADQIRRAATSIPANIAEGHGKWGKGQFLNHLSHSLGSLRELETLLIIAERVGYGTNEVHRQLSAQCDEIGRMLFSLSKRVAAAAALNPDLIAPEILQVHYPET